MDSQQKLPRRGIPLTTLLAVLALGQAYGLVALFVTWRDLVDHGRPVPVVLFVSLLLSVVALISLAGIWGWQLWAIYLFSLVAIAGLFIDLTFGMSAEFLAIRAVLLVAFAFAIKPHWELFRFGPE